MAHASTVRVRGAQPAAAPHRRGEASFAQLYGEDPLQRIKLIKSGVPASMPGAIADRMGISRDKLYATLGLPRATVERKVRESKPLSADEGSRVLGMGRLVGLVERMAQASGTSAGFDAATWTADWIERRIPALGDMRPAELMDTVEGQALVSDLLSRAQSGAYA